MPYHDIAMIPTHKQHVAHQRAGAFDMGNFAQVFLRDKPWTQAGFLDRLGMTISGLCLVLCVATTVMFALLSAAGGLLVSPLIHEIGLVIAIGFGALALWKGIAEHGYLQPAAFGGLGLGIMAGALTIPHGDAELVYTLFGVSLVALGHDLNIRASSRLR